MKILITGACGFVGSSLARYWGEKNPDWEIYGLDNLIRPGSELNRLDLKRRGVKILHADIRTASDFEGLPAVDYVIDSAANPSVLAGLDGRTSSRQLVEHNLSGTINMLEYCKTHRSGFVLLSTSRVYSIQPLAALSVRIDQGGFVPDASANLPVGISPEGIEETFSNAPPVSLYGATKIASETLALEYGESFHFPVWINRCGVLAGVGQFGRADQGIFSYWLHSWKQNRPLKYIGFDGLGHQVRDCLHPDDLALLIGQQMESTGNRDRLVNVAGGAGQTMSLQQLSAWCQQRWGKRAVTSDPTPRIFDLPWVVLNSKKASSIWNWKPEKNLDFILNEIALQAENNPDWLELSAP